MHAFNFFRATIIFVLAPTWACAASAQQSASVDRVITELQGGHAAEALRESGAALEVSPGDATLWTLNALAAKQLLQTSVAIASFNAALKIAPDYLPALEGVCELLYRQNPEEVQPYLTRLLTKLPDEPNANGMAAMLDYREGRFTEAVERFRKADTAIANQRSAMDSYADALARLQRNDEARTVLNTIVQQWPEDAHARYNLAILQSRSGEYDASLRLLQPLLDAKDEPALSLAASIQESIGNTPAAVELLRSAIAVNPKDPQNYIDFGALSFDHSSVRVGIVMLNAGIEQLPNSAKLYVTRGILHMQNSNVEEAEKDFARANELDPSQSFGLEAQGLSEMQKHNLPKALVSVVTSLGRTPNNAYLNYLAAEILKEQGAVPGSPQAAQAIDYARRAVVLDNTLVGARNLVGAFAFSAGDMPAALESSRATLRQDSTNQESLFRLILILRRTGDLQHEVPGLVERLEKLRADEHKGQQKVDRYLLFESEAAKP